MTCHLYHVVYFVIFVFNHNMRFYRTREVDSSTINFNVKKYCFANTKHKNLKKNTFFYTEIVLKVQIVFVF